MRKHHLLMNVSDETWRKFKKQAKSRGLELGYYLDLLVTHRCN